MSKKETEEKVTAAKTAEEKETAEKATEESLVAEEKAKAFREYLEKEQITGVELHEAGEAGQTKVFRSNFPVRGQNLPFMVLIDDSVYTLIQVEIAAQVVTEEKKAKVLAYLNDLNDQYRMLKYNSDAGGNVLLTCSVPSGVRGFDPALLVALLNQIQGHLNAVYPSIMSELWAGDSVAV